MTTEEAAFLRKKGEKRRFREDPTITRDMQLILFGFLLAFSIPVIYVFAMSSSQGFSYIGFVIGGKRVEPQVKGVFVETSLVSVLGQKIYEVNPELVFDHDGAYNMSLPGGLRFMHLSGSFSGSSFAVLVSDGLREYLVMNETYATGSVPTFTRDFDAAIADVENIYPLSKSSDRVDVRLHYQTASRWDSDDDGIEVNSSAIDLTVSNSKFHFPADQSKICSAWLAYSLDTQKSHSVCFGGEDCCRMYGIESSGGEWNETFYVYYGRLNATERDIVGSSVSYANLEFGSNSSGVVRGGWKFLPVLLYTPSYSFDGVCAGSCKTSGISENVSLIVKVKDGRLSISKIRYGVDEGDIVTLPVGRFILPARKVNITMRDKDGGTVGGFDFEEKKGKLNMIFSSRPVARSVGALAGGVPSGGGVSSAGVSSTTTTMLPPVIPSSTLSVVSTTLAAVEGPSAETSSPGGEVVPTVSNESSPEVVVPSVPESPIVEIPEVNASNESSGMVEGPSSGTQSSVVEVPLVNVSNESFAVGLPVENVSNESSGGEILLPSLENETLAGVPPTALEPSLPVENFTEPERALRIYGLVRVPNVLDVVFDNVSDPQVSTEVVAVVASGLQFDNATVVLPKRGRVNRILECVDFNLTSFECANWSLTNISVIDRGDVVEFSVSHFSAYAGAWIEVLNVHSFPTLYGNWTVAFNTTGIANLTITATFDPNYTFDPTRWSLDSEDSELYDLRFLGLSCGDVPLNYTWVGENCWQSECSVFVENFNCNGTAYETSRVFKARKHVLKFTYGDYSTYAYNAFQIVINSPYNGQQISDVGKAFLNFSLENATEYIVYGSNGTTYLGQSILYHRVRGSYNGTFTLNWTVPVVQPNADTLLILHFENDSTYGENESFIRDFSGNGNHVAVSGSVTINQTRIPAGLPINKPIGGNALYLTGYWSNYNATIEPSPTLDNIQNFTIAFWMSFWVGNMKKAYFGNDWAAPIISRCRGGGVYPNETVQFFVGFNDTGGNVIVAGFQDNSFTSYTARSSQVPPTLTPTHIAVVNNRTNLIIYINGVPSGSVSTNGANVTNMSRCKISIGKSFILNGSYDSAYDGAFNGTIDDLVIFNRSLSQAEINALLNLSYNRYVWKVRASNGTAWLDSGFYTFNYSSRPVYPVWGVLHSIHTTMSDGTMTPEQRAQQLKTYYDWATPVEHDYILNSSEWTILKNEVNSNNTDMNFTYMVGYEWRGVNAGMPASNAEALVFFEDNGPPDYVNGSDPTFDTWSELWLWLWSNRGIGCVNHPSRSGNVVNWSDPGLNDSILPCVEMLNKQYFHWNGYWNCSTGSGCTTYANPSQDGTPDWRGGVYSALASGHRLGFTAGWDYHSSPTTPTAYTGLSRAHNWSRTGVLASIRQRHTWAAQDKIWMDLVATNGTYAYIMGDLMLTNASSVLINYTINGTLGNRIINVSLFYDGVIVNFTNYSIQNVSGRYNLTFNSAGDHYFFVEAVQSDGKRAWTSPMYFTVTSDIFPPNVTLSSPSNGSTVYSTRNISFVCSATDDVSLANMTLYGNWKGWHANQTHLVSGRSNSSEFLVDLNDSSSYLWNCRVCDNSSNCAFFRLNNTFIINASTADTLNVTLVSPSVVSYMNSSSVTFVCDIISSGAGVSGLELYVWNSSGALVTSPQYAWNRTWGLASKDEVGTGVTVDSNGSIYVAGYSKGGGTTNEYLVKYNSSGTYLLNFTETGKMAYDVVTDSAGGVYLVGVDNRTGITRLYVDKFLSNGSRTNVTYYHDDSSTYFETGYGIDVDSFDNLYAVGGELPASSKPVDIVVSYNPTSMVQRWNTTYGGSEGRQFYHVATDSAGNSYAVGVLDINYMNGPDIQIFKYNSSGSLLWSNNILLPNSEEAYGVAHDLGESNIYVVGYTNSTGAGAEQFYILKYTSSGTHVWNRTIGLAGNDSARAVAMDFVGNIYVTGWTHIPGAGEGEFFTMKYNPEGNLIWNKTIGGGTYGDYANGIAADRLGGIYISGATNSYGAGGSDIWLVKYDTYSKGVSGQSNESSWTVALPSQDNYTWTCLGADQNGVRKWGVEGNYSLLYESSPPLVQAVYPANNTVFDYLNYTEFRCNISDNTAVMSIGLNIYNSSGGLVSLPFRMVWNDSTGSASSFDDIYDLATDNDNNVYAVGDLGGTVFWLLKYDKDGNHIWNLTYSTSPSQGTYGQAVAVYNDMIYATGYQMNGYGYSQIMVLKYNMSGDLQWNVTPAMSLWGAGDKGLGIAVDAAGFIYAVGSYSESTPSYLWLLKLNSSGDTLWNITVTGGSYDVGYDLALDTAGNVYVAGLTSSYGAGGNDVWVLRFNSTGSLVWNRTFGGTQNDFGTGIGVDRSGNAYVIGTTNSYGSSGDLLMLKYNSTGSLLWNLTAGSSWNDQGYHLALDRYNNIYATGSLQPTYTSPTSFWVLKVDPDGRVLTNQTVRDIGSSYGYGVAVDSENSIYYGGITSHTSPTMSYDTMLIKYGGYTNIVYGRFNTTAWNVTLPSIGQYRWNCEGYDMAGNMNASGSRYLNMTPVLYYCGALNTENAVYNVKNNVYFTGSAGSPCFTITAENVTLDCKGYTIARASGYWMYYGIQVQNKKNAVIRNCNINSTWNWYGNKGIDLEYANGAYLLNNTISYFDNGVYIRFSNSTAIVNNTILHGTGNWGGVAKGGIFATFGFNITVTGATIYNNSGYGVQVEGASMFINASNISENILHDIQIDFPPLDPSGNYTCSFLRLQNVTSSGGRTIAYYNASTVLSNAVFSELILCDADNSAFTNISISGSSDYSNNALWMWATDSSNLTNITSYGNNNGILATRSNRNVISNLLVGNNTVCNRLSCYYGIYLIGSSFNNISGAVISNINSSNAVYYGLYSAGSGPPSTNNIFERSTIANITNTYVSTTIIGIYIYSGGGFNITSNFIEKLVANVTNTQNILVIYLYQTNNNTIERNNILLAEATANQMGMYLYDTRNTTIKQNIIRTYRTMNQSRGGSLGTLYGIFMTLTQYSRLRDNNITLSEANGRATGISIGSSNNNNNVFENTLINISNPVGDTSFTGLWLGTPATNNFFYNTTIQGCFNTSCIYLSQDADNNYFSGGLVNGSTARDLVKVYRAKNNYFKDMTLTGTSSYDVYLGHYLSTYGCTLRTGLDNCSQLTSYSACTSTTGCVWSIQCLGTLFGNCGEITVQSECDYNTNQKCYWSGGICYNQGAYGGLSACSDLKSDYTCEAVGGCYLAQSGRCNGTIASNCSTITNPYQCENQTSGLCRIYAIAYYAKNTTFLNVSYNQSKENVTYPLQVLDSSELIRKWYYQAVVNDSLGALLSGADVSAYNATGHYAWMETTNTTGVTNLTTIVDYYNTGYVTKNWSPYSIYVVANQPGYAQTIFTRNINETRSIVKDTLTLTSDLIAPNISKGNITPQNNSVIDKDYATINLTAADNANDFFTFVDFDNSLEMWLPMDENDSNANPIDLSSHQTNIVTYGHTIHWDGQFGRSFRFNGADTYINVTANVSSILAGNGTISIWIKRRDTPRVSQTMVLYGYNDTTEYMAFHFYLDSSKYLNLAISNQTQKYIARKKMTWDNKWHHVAATWNETDMVVFVDGEAGNVTPKPVPPQTVNYPMWIGTKFRGPFITDDMYNGTMDEFLFFSRHLTWQEILSLYDGEIFPYLRNFTRLNGGSHCYKGRSKDKAGNKKNTGDDCFSVERSLNVSICRTLDMSNSVYNVTVDLNVTETNIDNCITISAENITFDCIGRQMRNLTGTNLKHFIHSDQPGTIIKNCVINTNSPAALGIYISNVSGARLVNNTIISQYEGIYLNGSMNALVENNTILRMGDAGIYLDSARNITIRNNRINGSFLANIYIVGGANVTVANNTVNSSQFGIYVYIGTSGAVIVDNKAYNNNRGIAVNLANGSRVLNNTIVNINAASPLEGIYIYPTASNTEIKNNYILSYPKGIALVTNSNNATITTNTIENATLYGIQLGTQSSNNMLTNNIMKLNNYSIYIDQSSHNRITGGIINSSQRNAITLSDASSDNNNISTVTITGTNANWYDIQFLNSGIDGTWLIDTPMNRYDLGIGNVKVNFKNSNSNGGEIDFLDGMSGSGQNLSSDVVIRNNYAYVNTSIGSSKRANISLYYSTPLTLSIPVIYKDATYCGANCVNTTTLTGNTVTFGVNGFSNYTIGQAHIPNITNIVCESPVTPQTSAYRWMTCNATCNDTNPNDCRLATTKAYFWDNQATTSGFGAENYNFRYYNASCTMIGVTGQTTANITCGFALRYWTNYSSAWSVNITVTDPSGTSYDTGFSTAGNYVINSYVYSPTPQPVNYSAGVGSIALGTTTSSDTVWYVNNTGNMAFDVQVNGTALPCTIGSIPAANLHYDGNAGTAWGGMCGTLTTSWGDTCTELNNTFDLTKTLDGTISAKPVYWRIQIPASGVGGACIGSLQIQMLAQ